MSGIESGMAKLRQRFLDSTARQADTLDRLAGEGDLAGIRHIAHGLAGVAGMFGFPALGDIAFAVDEAEDADLVTGAQQLVAALRGLDQERC